MPFKITSKNDVKGEFSHFEVEDNVYIHNIYRVQATATYTLFTPKPRHHYFTTKTDPTGLRISAFREYSDQAKRIKIIKNYIVTANSKLGQRTHELINEKEILEYFPCIAEDDMLGVLHFDACKDYFTKTEDLQFQISPTIGYSVNHYMARASDDQNRPLILFGQGFGARAFNALTQWGALPPHQRPAASYANGSLYPLCFNSKNDTFSARPVVESLPIWSAPDQTIDLPPGYIEHYVPIPDWRPDRKGRLNPVTNWRDPVTHPPIFARVTTTSIRSGLSSAGSGILRSLGNLGISTNLQPDTGIVNTAAFEKALIPQTLSVEKLRFELHYHSRVTGFMRALGRDGIPGLLTLQNQLTQGPSLNWFYTRYQPNDEIVAKPHPDLHKVDFEPDGAYSVYNWELFFHIPLLIATRLMEDQRFAEARTWFHYIFNPTSSARAKDPDKPWQRYWNLVKFRETEPERIAALLRTLSDDKSDPEARKQREVLRDQINDWRENPFQPHRLARLRLQAYQKSVVMKYIDNLIQWGDRLFRQDTIESINEATQLYLLAQDILGPRPQQIPMQGHIQEQTYADLSKLGIEEFGNALVPLEDALAPPALGSAGRLELLRPSIIDRTETPWGHLTSVVDQDVLQDFSSSLAANALWSSGPWQFMPSVAVPVPPQPGEGESSRQTLYFCIPQNDNLLGYWDRVADRLFKIRHCMNIEGVVRNCHSTSHPSTRRCWYRRRRRASTSAASWTISMPAFGVSVRVPVAKGAGTLCRGQGFGWIAAFRAGETGCRGALQPASQPRGDAAQAGA
jgi:hypothetical protein